MPGISEKKAIGMLPGLPHFAPKAKRAIYLHMMGAPPQMETFDYKPVMTKWFDKDLPDSIRQGQRLTINDIGADALSSGSFHFQVCAIRAERDVDLGAAAVYGEDGRRYRGDPVDEYGRD